MKLPFKLIISSLEKKITKIQRELETCSYSYVDENAIECDGKIKAYKSAIDVVKYFANKFEAKTLSVKTLSKVVTADFILEDNQYCWQQCCCLAMCGECKRLCNGPVDYFDDTFVDVDD